MTVTLETLRSDYKSEESRLRHMGVADVDLQGLVTMTLDPAVSRPTATDILAQIKRVQAKRELLNVAEEHGLKAAMLYKLSDGAIDPRASDAGSKDGE